MVRTLIAVLLLSLLAGWSWAQTPTLGVPAAPAAEGEAAAQPVPDLSGDSVPGEAVVELADFICAYLNDSGTVPDWSQVRMVNGQLRRISAAEVFALLARTVYLWDSTGELPATVPLAPKRVNPPQLDPEDIPLGPPDPAVGREVPTADFLAWCAETVYWIDRLHTIPTAVWLDGERLSAVEYLAGLAVCIQYAYYEGDLLDYLFLPRYAPPDSWVGASGSAVRAAQYSASSSQAESQTREIAAEEVSEEAPVPEREPETAEAAYPSPSLLLTPDLGAEVSGVVDVVGFYTGPPPDYVIFGVDGKTAAMTNRQPFSFRWDTSGLEPGKHTVRVRVYGKDDSLLIEQVSIYRVTARIPAEGKASE